MSSIPVPAARKKRKPHALSTIPATVAAKTWISPRMVRLTVHSPEMSSFVRPACPDQFVTFIFPRPGQELIELANDFTWEFFYQLSDATRPQARNYTVRSHDTSTSQIDVDVLVHGGPGLGENWAVIAEPGDHLYLWGPRVAYNPFPNADYQLLFCDECGLPAAAAIIEALPANVAGKLVAEIKHESAIPLVPNRDGFAIDWVFSGEAEPGEGSLLFDAIASLPTPGGLVYAWGGGEMEAMRQIGRYLRRNWGLKTSSISATGYWKLGVSYEN